jgi:prephenate dehydrogenase
VRPVCVVGLGLIGGSVLRAAHAAGRTVWGATASQADAEAATRDGFQIEGIDDALGRAKQQDAIVVIAVPLPAVDEVLRKVAAIAADNLLTDVVSVKGPVAESVRRLAPQSRYAGGHPMAGAAESGWAAGKAGLFQDAAWVVAAEHDTALESWLAAAELALDCGAKVVPTTAVEHDAAVALISHLPHVLAAVLASTGAEGGPLALALAAGSFGDGTRVAGSRPELVRAMCEGNRAALLAAVDDALGRLGVARGALASTGALKATIDAGHAGRLALLRYRDSGRETSEVDLADANVMELLRMVGEQGGRIVSIGREKAQAELPMDGDNR